MKVNLDSFLSVVKKILDIIGGIALTVMMFLTVCDVILRIIGHPILGAYEMVSLLLVATIGFTIPKVSLNKGHVIMEFILEKLPSKGQTIMVTFTRLLCIFLFVLIGYNLFLIANEFRISGEVSSTLKIPFFPIVYCLGICCFIECLVFVSDIIIAWRGQHE